MSAEIIPFPRRPAEPPPAPRPNDDILARIAVGLGVARDLKHAEELLGRPIGSGRDRA